MSKIELQTNTREVRGKKVRFLRRQNIVPVHLYGSHTKTLTLQCNGDELKKVISQARKTRLISLKVDEVKTPRNVVVREIQNDQMTGNLLHVDFYQVKMAEKIQTEVPIVFINESPALKNKDNMLLQEMNSLVVSSLPGNIPESFVVDLSELKEKDAAVHVKDLKLEDGVTIIGDTERMVCKISLRPLQKAQEKAEAVATTGEAAEGDNAEAEQPAAEASQGDSQKKE